MFRRFRAFTLLLPYRNSGDYTNWPRKAPQMKVGAAHKKRIRLRQPILFIMGWAVKLITNSPKP